MSRLAPPVRLRPRGPRRCPAPTPSPAPTVSAARSLVASSARLRPDIPVRGRPGRSPSRRPRPGSGPPRPARGRTDGEREADARVRSAREARVRSAPGIGFARRRGLGSLGAGDWLRSGRAPGPLGASMGRARAPRRPSPRPRAARSRTEVDETCTLGFARRGLGSARRRGLASLGRVGRCLPARSAPNKANSGPGRRRRTKPNPGPEAPAPNKAKSAGAAGAEQSQISRRTRTIPHRGEREAYARVRSAPGIGFARRRGLASLGGSAPPRPGSGVASPAAACDNRRTLPLEPERRP